MNKEMIISSGDHDTRVAILEEDQVVEIFIEREKQRGVVGNIYKGRVSKVLPGMQSSFVDIGLERDAFLYVTEVVNTVEEFDRLDRVLAEKYGEDAPSLRLVKEAISECRSLVESIVKKKGGAVERSIPEPVKTEEAMGSPAARPHVLTGVEPRDRADALFRLAAIAEYFRRTEPHSPVSYLVQRAARWGEMPLAEWLQEVIKDQNVLGDVRETLGMKEQETGGEG